MKLHPVELSLPKSDMGIVRAPTWAEVYREHSATVARWTQQLGGPALDAEDAVHEVFLVVRERLPHFRPEAKLTTWLYAITQNVVRHQRRKLRMRRWLVGGSEDAAQRHAHPAADASEALEREESNRRLYRVLDAMPERYRTALILFEMEGLSGAEISELVDVKVKTLWVWLHRARAEFLRRLQKLEAEETRG